MSDVNRILTSLLLSHAIRRYFWRIVVIEISYILERIFVFLEAQLITHLVFCFLISNVFADFGFVSTYGMRFERSGSGQEPSRGHKFSILENVLSIRDFTSQTLASFPSDLVGACLPQTLLIIRALRHEWNGVSCLHNFTEELSNRQEVQ